MKKNVAGQKWTVFAFDRTDNTPKTGDGGNITANVRIDGVQNAVDDTNPTEQEDGFYIFTITAAESNGDHLVICPASSTENIQVIGVPGSVWTTQEHLLTDALVNKAIWTSGLPVSSSPRENLSMIFFFSSGVKDINFSH